MLNPKTAFAVVHVQDIQYVILAKNVLYVIFRIFFSNHF